MLRRCVGSSGRSAPRNSQCSRSPHTLPHSGARLARVERENARHIDDARCRQPPLHVAADARYVAGPQRAQLLVQRAGLEQRQAVGLLHVGRHLGEDAIGRDADRAFQIVADVRRQSRLDPRGKRGHPGGGVLVVEQPARDFVDRAHRGHRHVALDLGDDPVVEPHILVVPRRHHDQVAAALSRLPDRRAGLDAERLRLIACRDRRGAVGHHRRDRHGPASQCWIELLLDAGEIAVEIEIQPAERGRIVHAVGPSMTSTNQEHACAVAAAATRGLDRLA